MEFRKLDPLELCKHEANKSNFCISDCFWQGLSTKALKETKLPLDKCKALSNDNHFKIENGRRSREFCCEKRSPEWSYKEKSVLGFKLFNLQGKREEHDIWWWWTRALFQSNFIKARVNYKEVLRDLMTVSDKLIDRQIKFSVAKGKAKHV